MIFKNTRSYYYDKYYFVLIFLEAVLSAFKSLLCLNYFHSWRMHTNLCFPLQNKRKQFFGSWLNPLISFLCWNNFCVCFQRNNLLVTPCATFVLVFACSLSLPHKKTKFVFIQWIGSFPHKHVLDCQPGLSNGSYLFSYFFLRKDIFKLNEKEGMLQWGSHLVFMRTL